MKLALLLVAALGACIDAVPPTPLADISTGVSLEIARDRIHVAIATDFRKNVRPDDCIILGDDVTATFDGVALSVAHGGWSDESDFGPFCMGLGAARLGDVDQTVATSTLLIADHSATWTIEVPHPFAANFVLGRVLRYGTLTWQDAEHGFGAEVIRLDAHGKQLSTQNILAETATTDLDWQGAATLQIGAVRRVTAARCDGPSPCDVSAEVETTVAVPE